MNKLALAITSCVSCCLLLFVLSIIGLIFGVQGLLEKEKRDVPPPAPETRTIPQVVDSYETCMKATNPKEITLIYPGTCEYEGKTYVQEIAESYTGTVRKITRPSPEIPYDYQLILIDPAVTRDTMIGGSGLPQKQMIIVAATPDVDSQLKLLVGKKATVTGTPEWGLAETKYLNVARVEVTEK